MKKVVLGLFLVGLFSLCSCSQSTQEKAETFAQELLKKRLNDPSTYEPVETKIDSIYNIIYFEQDVVEKLDELGELHSKLSVNDFDYSEAETKIVTKTEDYIFEKNLYSQPYGQDSFTKHRMDKAKKEIDAAKEKQIKLKEERKLIEKSIAECEKYIKEKYENAPKSQFIGWQIAHTFRLSNPSGAKTLRYAIFFVDKEIENLLLDEIIENEDSQMLHHLELLKSILGVESLRK